MSNCLFTEKCPFFNDKMATKPSMMSFLKKKYCLSDFEECARLIVRTKVGPQNVPVDLFPHQSEKIENILNQINTIKN